MRQNRVQELSGSRVQDAQDNFHDALSDLASQRQSSAGRPSHRSCQNFGALNFHAELAILKGASYFM